ncbi:MAG: hypothetical protein AAGB22_07780, partial [Bacteroidota bacterium]
MVRYSFLGYSWVLMLAMALPLNGLAQTCCSGGVPIAGSLGLSSAAHRSWQFMLTYDFNFLHDLVETSTELDDDRRTRETHATLLEVNYGLAERFTLTGLVSWIRQERNIISDFGTGESRTAQGIGDAVLLLKYRVTPATSEGRHELVVGAGPKIPVGQTDVRTSSGIALSADMQAGTGAWDGMFWVAYTQQQFLAPSLSLQAVATYRLTGTNPDFFGERYGFGNELQLTSGLSNAFIVKGMAFDALLFGRYRQVDEDERNGTELPNTGGQWAYLIPGV